MNPYRHPTLLEALARDAACFALATAGVLLLRLAYRVGRA